MLLYTTFENYLLGPVPITKHYNPYYLYRGYSLSPQQTLLVETACYDQNSHYLRKP